MKKLKDQKNRGNLRTKTMRKAYANAIRSIGIGVVISMFLSAPVVHSMYNIEYWGTPISQTLPTDSKNQESIDVEIQDTTQPPTTTVVTTTITTTITTTSTTTTVTTSKSTTTTTEEVVEDSAEDNSDEYEEYYEEEEVDSYEEYESEEEYYEEPVNDSSYSEDGYAGTFEATYYPGDWGTCGYVNGEYVPLTPGYSVASSYFPKGTLLYIVGGGLDGTFRVEDYCPSGDNILDVFYTYDTIPSFFSVGRINVDVYVIG